MLTIRFLLGGLSINVKIHSHIGIFTQERFKYPIYHIHSLIVYNQTFVYIVLLWKRLLIIHKAACIHIKINTPLINVSVSCHTWCRIMATNYKYVSDTNLQYFFVSGIFSESYQPIQDDEFDVVVALFDDEIDVTGRRSLWLEAKCFIKSEIK